MSFEKSSEENLNRVWREGTEKKETDMLVHDPVNTLKGQVT